MKQTTIPAEKAGVDGGGVEIRSLLRELTTLRTEMLSDLANSQLRLKQIHSSHRNSAGNLLHYLALRRQDLRPLQLRLAALGLSSLGRAEPNVLATLDAVIAVLHRLNGDNAEPPGATASVDFAGGQRLLREHTDALLGPVPGARGVRIMVTMPSEAADDYLLVRDLLARGMDCMRINCAHDDAASWLRMIENLRRAERALGRSCRVVMDLAGPKLRTGPVENGPAVVKIKPSRDVYGRVLVPARIWLTVESLPQPAPTPADACLCVSAEWLARLQSGDVIAFTDTRDAKRSLKVIEASAQGCWAEAVSTAYIAPGTLLRRQDSTGNEAACKVSFGQTPPSDNALLLHDGDTLILTGDLTPGRPATNDAAGRLMTPARIGCTIPEVFDDVRSGESIWFDDGKIGGVVEKVETGEVRVRINRARLCGEKLRGDKGINLPDSDLRLKAMTDKDVEDLAFVAGHADIVELSFANTAVDVAELQQRLAEIGSRQPAIVLKIETRRGFENLPDMLLTAMRAPVCGVMIARGDLAVECGYERMAEVQEEMLWICEAAHVPVIWATQVLETLARDGIPSRAEITDAAMGQRAECVMLNKGPHILSAVSLLDDILQRMQAHQAKNRAMLRELHLAHTLPPCATVPAIEPNL